VKKRLLPNCTTKQHDEKAKRKSHATAQRRNVKKVMLGGQAALRQAQDRLYTCPPVQHGKTMKPFAHTTWLAQ